MASDVAQDVASVDAPTNSVMRIAEINFESVLEARRRLIDEATSSSRWILATLVSVNLAIGAVAFSSEGDLDDEKLVGASLAGLGIFFAIMLGYSTILASDKLLKSLNEIANDWLTGMVGGDLDAVKLARNEASLLEKMRPWRIAAHILGWLSFASFFGAATLIAIGLA